ncbi:CMP/dCMP-type deaminase domain-containing protein [Aphelenchoides fujianensis]|nr:CMP/dCMP-type deaminase domain-containing protein [Aphelenchoides fujianensis]
MDDAERSPGVSIHLRRAARGGRPAARRHDGRLGAGPPADVRDPPQTPTFSPSFGHLKRVRDGRVVVGSAEEFAERVKELLGDHESSVEIQTTAVPKLPPATRRQFAFCQEFWPVRFKEDGVLERKLKGTFFSPPQLERLRELMDFARTSDGCVVTTRNFEVVGRAVESSMSAEEPLKHPFMRALDHVVHAHRKAAKRSASGEQYLATDCFVFVFNEPCAMCAMAMVHGRVHAVFFARASTNGAFVTNCRLHLRPQLNHHYDVFHLLI